MTELLDRLQTALGDAYRIDKELGGGGMSRVFLAEETALGRKVVVKVLPPEMAAGVNIERFRREIQLAASLQHPHIVPLHAAGQVGDLFYYTMPLVEGESLRAKLAREGELPVGDAVRILRDVVDALAYAHAHGVVHRDIKPDNVLISGQHAVVTDFGVAKAVSASSGSSTLTSLGVALGTPAYMAPEQAAADPHVDHRADLYAVGAMAYEMLCGRPPFTGMTPQATLAAHVTQVPEPPSAHRPAMPAALNALVMRCLEKKPADRVQRAEDLLGLLASMSTPSGGMAPTGTTPISSGTEAAIRHSHPIRVTALFVTASAAVLGLVYLLMIAVGLPSWVLAGAVALLVVGLPIMLLTGRFERQRAVARTTGLTPLPPAGGLPGLFTWRKTILGGALAFAALGVGTATYMGMRALGIGPIGTLVASGALKDRQKVLLAEFVNRAADTTLGPTLTEAFRVDLAQSHTVKLMDASAVGEALQRMQHDPGARLTPELAREVAQREGVTAVVTGQIDPVDKGYLLSASIVSTADGQVLTAVRATAADGAQLIEALDHLSSQLRERIGESFKTIRATAPLEQVTTGSLEALRKYSQAIRLFDQGNLDAALPLLQDATALDTGFAMAYRKLAVVLNNMRASTEQIAAATTRAFKNRDRLPELERNLTTAYYYDQVDRDPVELVAAYRAALDLDPNDQTALNNLGLELLRQRQWAAAESLFVRGLDLGQGGVLFGNAIAAQVLQGHFPDAQATLERYARAAPHDPGVSDMRGFVASALQDYPSAERAWRQEREQFKQSAVIQEGTSWELAMVAAIQGRMGQAAQHLAEAAQVGETRGLPQDYVGVAIFLGSMDVQYGRAADGLRRATAALSHHPLVSMPAADRPYAGLADFYARAGRADEAERLLTEYERVVPAGLRRNNPSRLLAAGSVARARGRPADAIAQYRAYREESGCPVCGLFEEANAFEQAGQPDSALAAYGALVTRPAPFRIWTDALALAPTFKRLGELYEAKGDRARARDYYGRFVDLWKGADPELQPAVRDVQQRIARLTAER
jgi:tetratricopeptide (TPR) repeat protein